MRRPRPFAGLGRTVQPFVISQSVRAFGIDHEAFGFGDGVRPMPAPPPGHRPPRSGCGRGRLIGRNRPGAATRRWRARERFVAADAVVVELRADYPGFHPLVPKRPVGVLLAVAHGQIAVTPSTTRAVTLRHVRFVRVRRISAGNRSRKHKRRSTTQYRSAMASKLEFHFDSLKTLNQYSRFQAMIRTCG